VTHYPGHFIPREDRPLWTGTEMDRQAVTIGGIPGLVNSFNPQAQYFSAPTNPPTDDRPTNVGSFGGGPPNTQQSTPMYISPAAVDNRATAVPSSTADQRMLDFARRAGSGTTVRPPGDLARSFSPEAVRQTPVATVGTPTTRSPEAARAGTISQRVADPADRALINIAKALGSGTVSRRGVVGGQVEYGGSAADRAMMDFAERVGSGTATVPPPVAAPSPYGPNPQMVVPPPPLTVASPYGPNPQMVGPDTSDLGPPSMWGPNPQMPNPADQPAWDAIERVVEAEFGPNQSIYNPEYDTEQFPTYDPSAPPTWGGGPDGEFPGGDFGDGDLGGGNPLEIVNPDTDPVSPFEGVGGNSSDHARKLAYINFMRDALGRQGLRGFADIEREFLLAQRALPGAYNRRGLLDSGQYARGKGLLGDSASRASGRFMSDLRDQYFNLALSEGDANNAYSSEGFAALQALADKLAGEAASIGTVGFGAI